MEDPGGYVTNHSSLNSVVLPENSDHSVLQQPLNVGVKNVKQILKCIQNGSPEVKDLILNECNIVYECKLCFNLFRSLANFLYHKRVYCKNHLCEDMLLFETLEKRENNETNPLAVSGTVVESMKGNENSVGDTDVSSVEQTQSANLGDVPLIKPIQCSLLDSRKHSSKMTQLVFEESSLYSTQKDFQETHRYDVEREADFKNDRTNNNQAEDEELETVDSFHAKISSTSSTILPYKVLKKDSDKMTSVKVDNIAASIESDMKTPFVKSVENRNNITSIKRTGIEKSDVIPVILNPIHGNANAVLQRVSGDSGNRDSQTSLIQSDVHTVQDTERLMNKISDRTSEKFHKVNEAIKNNFSTKDIHLSQKKRLLNRSDCNVTQRMCCRCHIQFTTLKTLYYHMVSLHSQKRMYYPCPFCKTLFVQMYGVTRHLMHIHGKKKEQINKKLKETIRKKVVWKYISEDQVDIYKNKEDQFDLAVKDEPEGISVTAVKTDRCHNKDKVFHSYTKHDRSVLLHYCSKCNRVFSRKSSQVSHEKFCIMNSRQENFENSPTDASVSFNSSSSLRVHNSTGSEVSSRPKRDAGKQMHKDFVNSQTLKWLSANKIGNGSRTTPLTKSKFSRSHEKKIMSVINITKLLCLKCNKKFSSFSNLRRHAAIHTGWTRYKCIYCNLYKSYNRSECKQHAQRAHSVPEDDLDKYIISLIPDVKSGEKLTGNDGKLLNNKCLKNKMIQNKFKPSSKTFHGKNTSERTKTSLQKSKKSSLRGKTLIKTKDLATKCETDNSGNVAKKNCIQKISEGHKVSPCIEKLQMSYKTSTPSSPTTIILSKTCASSTVQIMKNHASVSFCNSEKNVACSMAKSNLTCNNIETKKGSEIPCKILKQSSYGRNSCMKDGNADPKISNSMKNKTISEWFTKNPTNVIATTSLMSRHKNSTAPFIIGLVPAHSAKLPATTTNS